MAHIHLEDGSFTLFWVIFWWAVTLAIIIAAVLFLRYRKTDSRHITIAAFCTAAAFAVSQIEVPIAGGVHFNLTPLIGILAGPATGSLVVLVINILSAAAGHGGWGLIGANALVNLSEVLAGYGIFRGLRGVLPALFPRVGIATFTGLMCGNAVMIAIILISGIQGVTQTPGQVLAGLSLIALLNTGVAVIEALVTGFVVSSIGTMRPDLLGESPGKAGP